MTQILNSGVLFENTTETQLINKLMEFDTAKTEKIDNDFNKSFSYNVRLSDSDDVAINDNTITTDTKHIKNIKVVCDSNTAKDNLKNTYGIDLNKVYSELKKNGCSFGCQKVTNILKVVTKAQQ